MRSQEVLEEKKLRPARGLYSYREGRTKPSMKRVFYEKNQRSGDNAATSFEQQKIIKLNSGSVSKKMIFAEEAMREKAKQAENQQDLLSRHKLIRAVPPYPCREKIEGEATIARNNGKDGEPPIKAALPNLISHLRRDRNVRVETYPHGYLLVSTKKKLDRRKKEDGAENTRGGK